MAFRECRLVVPIGRLLDTEYCIHTLVLHIQERVELNSMFAYALSVQVMLDLCL